MEEKKDPKEWVRFAGRTVEYQNGLGQTEIGTLQPQFLHGRCVKLKVVTTFEVNGRRISSEHAPFGLDPKWIVPHPDPEVAVFLWVSPYFVRRG